MKIKSVSCEQFAGIRDRSVSLDDGINVIYGKNESGKSTLVNLISRTLFQNAKVDGRTDKAFVDTFFPGSRKGSTIELKDIDGKISFETENGTYILSKEWGSEPSCKLNTPDGIIKKQSAIDEILKEILVYGEGLYKDMIFSAQSNAAEVLMKTLDSKDSSESKKDITAAVSQAFSEGDGVSIEEIEQAINKKIEEIEGSHWDFEANVPVRKKQAGRWSNGRGTILEAFYKVEDAKTVLDKLSSLETDAERAMNEFAVKDAETQEAKKAVDSFETFANLLTVQSMKKKEIARIEEELIKIEKVLDVWPKLSETLEKAKKLNTEKKNHELAEKYTVAKQIADGVKELQDELDDVCCPSDAEIKLVKSAQRELNVLESKLSGMDLKAVIKMLGDNTVTINSLRTGDSLDIEDGAASITEAVKITVPGVMEMKLMPADVDAEAVGEKIAQQTKLVDAIFDKYSVICIDELEQKKLELENKERILEAEERKLELTLGGVPFASLEAEAALIDGQLRTKDEINGDITVVCGGKALSDFISGQEVLIEKYTEEHVSVNELKGKAFDLQRELMKMKESVGYAEDIPAELLSISNPEMHRETLKKVYEQKQELREAALTRKTAASKALETYKDGLCGDPAEDLLQAETLFNETKTLLGHWKHIQKIFNAERENVQNNPMEGLAQSFTDYLSIISGGRVSSEFPDGEKLDMNIYSGNNLLDYKKLSEGTKETVSLAFRLAVLDHLFPDGGGVIVFDDPFANMDAERTAQSCELIKECAKQHQVLFLTCKEEYIDMLNGNLIRI